MVHEDFLAGVGHNQSYMIQAKSSAAPTISAAIRIELRTMPASLGPRS